MRLLADDLAQITAKIEQEAIDEQAAIDHRARVHDALVTATAEQDAAQARLREATPALQRAQDTWFALSALAERMRGTIALAAERARNLSGPARDAGTGRDPDQLEEAAARAEAEQAVLQEAVEAAADELAGASAERAECEAALRTAEAELVAANRLIADRREGLARLAGQVQAARSRLAAGDDEVTRLAGAVTEARQRAAAADQAFATAQDSVGDLDSSEVGLDEAHEEAAAAAEAAVSRAAELTDALRTAQTETSTLSARVEALSLGIDRRDGTQALLTAGRALPGLIGAVSDALEIAPGFETAIAAALGPVADAVAVGTVGDAVQALGFLREQDGGRAGVLVQGPRTRPDRRGWPDLPAGAHWAVDLLTSKDAVAPALARWLDRVVVVSDMTAAVDMVQQIPDVRAVTVDGDLIGPDWAVGGSTDRQSVLEITATRDRAAEQLTATRERVAELTAALAGARAEVDQRRQDEARTLAALHHSDARMSAVAEELARFGAAARSAAAEAERLDRQRQAAEAAQEQHRSALSDLQDRLFAVQSEDAPEEVDPAVRDALAERTAIARQREVEARLVQRTAEERARATEGNAEALRRSARQERQHRQRVAAAEARRAASSAVAIRVVELGQRVARRLEISLADAAVERDRTMAARTAAESDLAAVRLRAGELQSQWERLTDAVHSTEVLRAQQTQQLQQLSERSIEEFTIPADELIAGYGPHVPVPPTLDEMAEYQAAKDRGDEVAQPPAMPYDRPSQERRLKRAERDLTALGKVNPLALEEFAALEERHKFLATQLEDLKATRKDLLSVIKEVDEKILELFESAYFDVAREFKAVFSTLFPGGEGELVLTDPSDMLATGIEVNARPPGKKVKRLSLLSGGERSLTAVALLVAIFRARPSPFYIMDEVEAALDEVNLTRLVGLMTELRESSQLIVVTHQKFTMESADALYGVSMRGDGITQVISQRIRERPESPTARREAVGAAS